MIVHDSFWSAFSPKIGGLVKNGRPKSSAAASEIRVYIQDDNYNKENIEDQDNFRRKH